MDEEGLSLIPAYKADYSGQCVEELKDKERPPSVDYRPECEVY